jgi:hypothetical protein
MFVDNPIHRARVSLGIPLTEVAARTFLSPRIIQKIDDGAFDQLPGGVYARSYIRTFAALVGLDPDETVDQLSSQLPAAEDPLPVLRQNIAVGESFQFGWWLDCVHLATFCAAPFRALRVQPRRWMATSIDACVLLLIYGVLVLITGWILDLPFSRAFAAAGIEAMGPWTALATCYVLLFVRAGRTAGTALLGLPANPPIRLAIPRRLFH